MAIAQIRHIAGTAKVWLTTTPLGLLWLIALAYFAFIHIHSFINDRLLTAVITALKTIILR